MTQATTTIGANKSGVQYRTEDNDGKKALLNHHKGSTAPAYAEAGIVWLDDTATPWILKIYDGADWITIASVNASTNAIETYHGTSALRLLNHATDTGAANAYAAAPVPAITAYATGQVVTLKPANANTGASTLAVSGLTAKNIKLLDGGNPASGALVTTGIYHLVYDGTNFVLLNSSSSQTTTLTGGVTGSGSGSFAATVAAVTNTATVTVKDANFTIQDDGDTTKQVKFQASGITTGTTRTLTAPNADGTIATTADILAAATQAQMEAASSNTVSATPLAVKWNPGVAKAWCKLSGATWTIDASLNVSSITDNGAGDFTVNFTTAFSTANYAYAGCAKSTGTIASSNFSVEQANLAAPAAGSCRMNVAAFNGGNLTDSDCAVAFFGDQ